VLSDQTPRDAAAMPRVYLDHNATTPLASEVFEAMRPYFLEDYGNASSIHAFGQRARAAVEEARVEVARLINADPAEVVFTSGGTEGDNTAVFGVVEAAETPGGTKHVVTTAIEHPAVLYAARALEERGVRVIYVGVDAGGVADPEEILQAIQPDTVLISVMYANNEIGTLQPIAEIGRLARERGIPFHSDAVQAAGKVEIDVGELGVDLLTLSAHKICGPKGVGALYVRKGTRLRPLLHGGHHERDRRPGTENVPGMVGLGVAARLARERLAEDAARVGALRDRLEAGLLDAVPLAQVSGDRARRLPTTTNLRFAHVDGEALVIALDLAGVACSTGAACSSGSLEPSHVLAAMGLRREEARSSIRFSLGRTTAGEDIDVALEVVPRVVERLRSISPRYKKTAMAS
jgi:cysteine desulfurase